MMRIQIICIYIGPCSTKNVITPQMDHIPQNIILNEANKTIIPKNYI
jgi:hypothetical protein